MRARAHAHTPRATNQISAKRAEEKRRGREGEDVFGEGKRGIVTELTGTGILPDAFVTSH